MMGRDWRLRTAASYGPFVHPRVICDVDHGWWYQLGLSPNLSTRALWQPPVLAGFLSAETSLVATSTVWFPAIRDTSGASGRWAKEMRIEYIRPRWTSRDLLTCRKILRHGTSGFTSHPKKVCCGFLSPLKIHRLGRARTSNLWVQWQAH
jgi:hypothetical protein